jgi:hypothetical protein
MLKQEQEIIGWIHTKGDKMNVNQYKLTSNNEAYTYPTLILPLIPFIEKFRERKGIKNKKDMTIWCPFDLKEDMEFNGIKMFRSNYVDIFEKEGYNVIASHIATGQDFFEYEPEEKWDIIISNPPFKNKKLFFERALSFKKPFALVSMASWLNDSGVYNLFKNERLQLLMPDKRARFFNEKGCIGKQPSFKSIYYCIDFLTDKDIEWFTLDKKLDIH